jgi:hypothetical protein
MRGASVPGQDQLPLGPRSTTRAVHVSLFFSHDDVVRAVDAMPALTQAQRADLAALFGSPDNDALGIEPLRTAPGRPQRDAHEPADYRALAG